MVTITSSKMATSPSNLHSKLPSTGTSIFTVMSQMAQEYNAINLSQGFPDFSSDPKLIKLVGNYMRKGFNQYAPMQGIIKLREAIAEKMEFMYTAKYDPETEITITAGATQAIYTAITSVVNEGDEVIVFEPAYDCYVPAIKINGGVPIQVELEPPDYSINWANIKKLISQRTRLIILNTPQNPTGSVLSAADMLQLDKITQNTDIMILSDEVYEHIIFDKLEHQSIARYPNLVNRSFLVFSFGKTFHNTGWKIGYCLAPENMMKEFRKIHQFIVFTVNTPMQHAFAEFVTNKDNYLQLSQFYEDKRNYFNDLLTGSNFKIIESKGTYFELLDYSEITEEADTAYAERLTKDNGIASIPISVFYRNTIDRKILRFCFAKSEETLQKAAEKLCKI